MPNKIVIEVEALDYEVTERDVAEALKSHFPNMPTRVREIRPTQLAADACPVCAGEAYIQTITRGLVKCATCNGTGRAAKA